VAESRRLELRLGQGRAVFASELSKVGEVKLGGKNVLSGKRYCARLQKRSNSENTIEKEKTNTGGKGVSALGGEMGSSSGLGKKQHRGN